MKRKIKFEIVSMAVMYIMAIFGIGWMVFLHDQKLESVTTVENKIEDHNEKNQGI